MPTWQMEWLAEQLDSALAAHQRVVVFVHFRLDGGVGGPVGRGLGPACPPHNRAWIDDCTLQNGAAVRAVLERHPGLVLATFSGHDHTPIPAWTRQDVSSPVYWTHHGLIEGHYPASNAYSLVTIHSDCSLMVQGFGNATSASLPGPPNCTV